MTQRHFTVRDLADGALCVEYPQPAQEEANAQAAADARTLTTRQPPGLLDAVIGARTLYLEFDPERTCPRDLVSLIIDGTAPDAPEQGRTLRIPVFYGGSMGCDLEDLARAAGLSSQEFARRHAQAAYRVAFLGFAPGFAYLSGLPAQLHSPRLPTPRTRIPAGAVAIGGPYTGIYPGDTPGGWRLIGRAGVRLFDSSAQPPAFFLPGDHVVFEPVAHEDQVRLPDLPDPASRLEKLGPPLFQVLSPGVFSSLQAAPRYGWSRYGIPPGGAMDSQSLASGNRRLGNPPDAAAVEMTLVGAEIEALADGSACLSGAALDAQVSGRAIGVGEVFPLRSGDRLRAARITGGARCYLCVEGGLAMSNRPQLSPRLKGGDILYGAAPSRPGAPPSVGSLAAREGLPAEIVIRVVLDPQRGYFSEKGVITFFSSVYRVSAASDRRGLRLEGVPIELQRLPDIPPEGTPLGGIQVALDGMPIVLGPDRPVTGGYARIATVIRADFRLLAQAIPGLPVRFVGVDLAEAVAARVG